ncbi:MAG: hypothetical protein ACMG6E_02715, partial [Candidatus Roizmanbacteria bacterium]
KEKSKISKSEISFDKSLGELLLLSESVTKEEGLSLILACIEHVREKVKTAKISNEKYHSYAPLLKDIQETYSVVLRNNVNPQLALDHIFMQLSKIS